MLKRILAKTPRISLDKSGTSRLPDSPGVYIFLKGSRALYIGKAISLKKRVSSYFLLKVGPKTSKMRQEADCLTYIKVSCELEALLVEAELIRKEQPPYNTVSKDDKHPLYIKITNEEYPRVLTARKAELKQNLKTYFGPFPSSAKVKEVLKMLRKIIPYSEHKIGKKACLYFQLGLCRPCPSAIEQLDRASKQKERQKYRRNISLLTRILSGKSKSVLDSLNKEMLKLSKEERFEEAGEVKEKIEKLLYITQPVVEGASFIENPNLTEDIYGEESRHLRSVLQRYINIKVIRRIECFDVAHLSGTKQTASMVTFINGEAEKNLYRHYRIKSKKKADDIASLKEVAERRYKALKSWGKPDLIIVDGGRAQVAVFKSVFDKEDIPVVGLAKSTESLVIAEPRGTPANFIQIRVKGPGLNLLVRIRDEAHRFAQRYHHLLVRKSLLP